MDMQHFCMVLIASLLLSSGLYAQVPSTMPRKEVYRAWISPVSAEPEDMGYLYGLKDSLLEFVANPLPPSPNNQIFSYAVQDIDKLKFRGERSIRQGAGLAAIVGFGLGFSVGYATSKLPPGSSVLEEADKLGDSLGYGAIGAVAAGVTGALIGRSRIKIRIRGEQAKYEKQKKALKRYQLSHG